MNIEHKLEDPKYCNGCLLLDIHELEGVKLIGAISCRKKIKFWLKGDIYNCNNVKVGDLIPRPKECIEANGE